MHTELGRKGVLCLSICLLVVASECSLAAMTLESYFVFRDHRSRVFVPFTVTTVPIPPAVLLLGSALTGLVALSRRKVNHAHI